MKLVNTTLFKLIELKEFLPYIIIGTFVTAIDWSVFSLVVTVFHFHYQIGLLTAYMTAGIAHYTANKMITFQCRSKELRSQLFIYLTVTLSSLLFSMGIIATLINLFLLNSILARILTTFLMIVPNYLLHKHLTFSKKIFTPPPIF